VGIVAWEFRVVKNILLESDQKSVIRMLRPFISSACDLHKVCVSFPFRLRS
jgi:hypothetical protein